MNTRRIALDLNKSPCLTPVVVGMGDRGGATITASITDGGEVVSLSGASVKLVAVRSDGIVELPCTVSGNTATVTFGESDVGESCEAFMRIIVGERKYSTGRFQIRMLREVGA